MAAENEILKRTGDHVSRLLTEELPPNTVYHNLAHTMDVIKAAHEIGTHTGLNASDMEIVLLACWFHDTGYIHTLDAHEEAGVRMASSFLTKQGYPDERIEKVSGCIRATKIPQRPSNLLEQVVCDADLAHLGKDQVVQKGELLRLELDRRFGKTFTDLEWLRHSIDFIGASHFWTEYARREYEAGRSYNLLDLRRRVRDMESKEAGRT
jgi:hypothetical protein